MASKYESPQAFRQALDERLRKEHFRSGIPQDTLRKKVLLERLLARLFARTDAPWLLKGGYALELRFRPRARTTRDIDLSLGEVAGSPLETRLDHVRDALQRAGELDLDDFLRFEIGRPAELMGAPLGGGTFPVVARLGGKEFGRSSIDAGFGDALVGVPEELVGHDLLEYAGIAPARVRAIPKALQFAEKIHAYTLPWTDRVNTRVKDLVDLLILIDRGALDADELRTALRATFETRRRQELPRVLPPPPPQWRDEFQFLATETSIAATELDAAFERLTHFWNQLMRPTG
jgi:hypothetical protein